MAISVFNDPNAVTRTRRRGRVRNKLRPVTMREFGGGWNEIDAPVGLSTRFASVLKNWYRKQDGSQAVRYGTRFKTDIVRDALQRQKHGTFTAADTGVETVGDSQANKKSFGVKFLPAADGDAFDVFIEVTTVTVGGNWVAALYSDNAGNPDTNLGESNTVNITGTGFQKFSFIGVDILQGTVYWIVFTDQTASGNIAVRAVANQGGDIATGHSDDPTTIADDQFDSNFDLKFLVNIYFPIDDADIVDFRYFNGHIISVTESGKVIATDAEFDNTVIWDAGVAASLESAAGWSTGLEFVSFTEIKGSLVICNGIDKPLEVTEDVVVRYLQDLAIGTNVNTPIGKYCVTASNYLCIAGVVGEESVVYIGSEGTVGTFPGDEAPNDAISIDLGAYVPEDSRVIRGLSAFRGYLFVHFLSGTLPVVLGEYDADGNHVPRPNDALQKFGLLTHRCTVPVVNDLLFADSIGMNTIKRNVLSGEVEPDRLSELIAPAYQAQVAGLTQDEQLVDIFSVHDRLSGLYMLFVPTGVDDLKRVFVFSFNERMRIKAWSEFAGWKFRCATSSSLGRVFFAKGTRIYQYGNEAFNEEYSADLIGDYDFIWNTNTAYEVGDRVLDTENDTVYICQEAHTSTEEGTFEDDRTANDDYWMEYEGEDIEFDWELPWSDAGARSRLKRLAFVSVDSSGEGKFSIALFVDNYYKDEDGAYTPALELAFVAGDSPGYGGGDQPYGGGRRTKDERLWSHPVKFKLLKLRLYGATKKPIRIIAITELFAEGKYGR